MKEEEYPVYVQLRDEYCDRFNLGLAPLQETVDLPQELLEVLDTENSILAELLEKQRLGIVPEKCHATWIPLFMNDLLEIAKKQIQDSYGDVYTDHFILVKQTEEMIEVGYLSYYLEELEPELAGEPCEYCVASCPIIDGDLTLSIYCNYDPQEHPLWEEICNPTPES